jgi:predicted O-methyltransferase YrrM
MKLQKAFQIVPLVSKLRRTQQWDARAIVDFSLANPVIRPIQVRSELQQFAEIAAKLKPKIVMEIGTNYGGTLCILSRLAAHDATIISVDLPDGEFGGGYKWFHIPIFKFFRYAQQKLHLLRGDSHSSEMSAGVRDIIGHNRKIDLLFIDGDHSYEGVKKDFDNYADLVRPGGIVAFHDIAEHTIKTCQVSRFWDEVKHRYPHQEIIEDRNQGWAGIGILYV